MRVPQSGGGLGLKFLVDKEELFQAPGVEGLTITAAANTFGRGDERAGKIVLFQNLQQVPGGVVFLQVEED